MLRFLSLERSKIKEKDLNMTSNIFYQMVNKITKSKIIGAYLSDYSRKYYLREMGELLNKPHQTIKPYLESMVKEGVLIKVRRKNLVEYGLNHKDKRIYDLLIIAEKEKLMERLNEDTLFRILFEKLSPLFSKNIFIVFGSSVDKIKKESDIDILIIGNKSASSEAEDFEKIFSKKLHIIQVKDLNLISESLTKEIYKKHIILNNTEKVIRFFGGLYEQNKLV